MINFEDELNAALENVTHYGWKLATKTLSEKARDFDNPEDIIFVIDDVSYNITTQEIY